MNPAKAAALAEMASEGAVSARALTQLYLHDNAVRLYGEMK